MIIVKAKKHECIKQRAGSTGFSTWDHNFNKIFVDNSTIKLVEYLNL